MVFLSLAEQRFIQSGHLLLGLQFRRLERLGSGCRELDREGRVRRAKQSLSETQC